MIWLKHPILWGSIWTHSVVEVKAWSNSQMFKRYCGQKPKQYGFFFPWIINSRLQRLQDSAFFKCDLFGVFFLCFSTFLAQSAQVVGLFFSLKRIINLLEQENIMMDPKCLGDSRLCLSFKKANVWNLRFVLLVQLFCVVWLLRRTKTNLLE